MVVPDCSHECICVYVDIYTYLKTLLGFFLVYCTRWHQRLRKQYHFTQHLFGDRVADRRVKRLLYVCVCVCVCVNRATTHLWRLSVKCRLVYLIGPVGMVCRAWLVHLTFTSLYLLVYSFLRWANVSSNRFFIAEQMLLMIIFHLPIANFSTQRWRSNN
jgi:hypothetical protein